MLSDEEKQKLEQEFQYALDNIVSKIKGETATAIVCSEQSMILLFRKLMLKIEKQSKEIEELKASHITTNNKATNTEKAKIFDVIENSIDTYIEKSKPYWEQIMTKDEMTIEEALTIIDDMYQDRYKIMSQKTEKETIVDLSKMDYIRFTNLEWASVRVLREVQSLNHKFKKWEDKIKAKIEERNKWLQEYDEQEEMDELQKDDYRLIKVERNVLQSLLEKE